VVRLTAADGYSASRSYSVASPPDESAYIELTVERLEDGEVSSYMHDVVVPGDQLEVRGPVGGWFVWRGDTPALLVGGGSGIVPLMAMLRLARRSGRCDPSASWSRFDARTSSAYAEELPARRRRSCTRVKRLRWGHGHPAISERRTFVTPCCQGPRRMSAVLRLADHVTGLLARLAVPAKRIRVERFGPTN